MYDKRQKSGGGDNNEGAGEDNLHIEFEDPLMQMIHTVMKHRANAQPQVRVQANGGGGNVYTQVPSETDGEKGGLGALRRGRGESIVHAINQKLAKSSEDHRQSLLEAVTESDTKLLSGLKDIMTACFQPLTDKRPREVPEKSDAPVDPSLLQWLKKHSLEAHAPKFAAEEITLASLKYLEKENLVEMGMAIGPRNLVWGLIQDGKASGGFV